MLDAIPHKKTLPPAWQISNIDLAPNQRQAEYAPLGISVHYSNGLAFPVTVTLRNGVTFSVPPATGTRRYSQSFTIQTRYYFGHNVNVDVQRVLDEVDETSGAELKLFKDAWERSDKAWADNSRAVGLDYHISKQDLVDNGGSIYVEALDVVLAYGPSTMMVVHPYSEQGKLLAAELGLNDLNEFGETSFSINMHIVDKEGKGGKRFLNFCGSVYEIPVVTQTTRPDGLYINRSKPLFSDDNITTGFVTLERAKKVFSLYYSADEAREHGDPASARERELKEWDHKLKQEDLQAREEHKRKMHELDMLKADLSEKASMREDRLNRQAQELEERKKLMLLEKAEMDREAERIKHLRDMESLNRKDEYESRSYQRKDTSELLKWVPTTVLAIAGVLATMRNFALAK